MFMEHSTEKMGISSALRRLERGLLNLSPVYQRNAVWTKSQKQLLIDSILSGIPVPSLYWNKVDENTIDVVDGQQRLRSMQEFKNGDFCLNEDSNFGSKLYDQLTEVQKDDFDEYQLTIIKLKSWTDEQIEDMFLRLQDGSPLNAAEKRRAIQGTFRDVVRELSENPFFEHRVAFNNNRYGFEDAAAKALHLIFNGWVGISASKIKETYKNNSQISINHENPKALKKAYKFIDKGFKLIELNPKLKKWASITLPIVIKDLNEGYVLTNLEKNFAESFMELEQIRHYEREKEEENQNPKIINFNDAARADDPARLKSRHDFLKNWFLEKIDDLEPILRDSQRIFTQEQRVILYARSGGKCQLCNTPITQDNFDADHIIRYTDGGKTSLNNGRALCITCNRSR